MINMKALFKTVGFVLAMGTLFIIGTLITLLISLFPIVMVAVVFSCIVYVAYIHFLNEGGR